MHGSKKKLAENSHSRVIVERDNSRRWQAEYSHLK